VGLISKVDCDANLILVQIFLRHIVFRHFVCVHFSLARVVGLLYPRDRTGFEDVAFLNQLVTLSESAFSDLDKP